MLLVGPLQMYGWKWGMFAPGIIGTVMGLLILLGVRDSPEASECRGGMRVQVDGSVPGHACCQLAVPSDSRRCHVPEQLATRRWRLVRRTSRRVAVASLQARKA